MRATQILASLVFLASTVIAPTRADAQCVTITTGGPRVRVIGACLHPAPPVFIRTRVVSSPVVVLPAPPPIAIVPPPPVVVVQPAPPPPPPPPVMVYPVAPEPPPMPTPVVHHAMPRPQIFTLGMFVEGTMFKDGGLGGGGLYAQIRVGRALHLFGSLGAAGSCTNCSPDDLHRVDLKTTFGLQYYFANHARFAPYLRGSLVYQSVSFQDPNDTRGEAKLQTSQFGTELAAGFELRLLRWLVLSTDVAYIGLKRIGDEHEGAIPIDAGKGVATVNNFDHGATFRLNAAIRF